MLKLQRARTVVVTHVVTRVVTHVVTQVVTHVVTQVATLNHIVLEQVGAHPVQTGQNILDYIIQLKERIIVQLIAHGHLIHRLNRTVPCFFIVHSEKDQMTIIGTQ